MKKQRLDLNWVSCFELSTRKEKNNKKLKNKIKYLHININIKQEKDKDKDKRNKNFLRKYAIQCSERDRQLVALLDNSQ